MAKEERLKESDKMTIAGKPDEVYLKTILDKFQRFDQIEISVLDTYLDKAIHIIRQWEAMGVYPENGWPLRFVKSEEDIVGRDGKSSKAFVNKVTLTKHPDIYRFTKN